MKFENNQWFVKQAMLGNCIEIWIYGLKQTQSNLFGDNVSIGMNYSGINWSVLNVSDHWNALEDIIM